MLLWWRILLDPNEPLIIDIPPYFGLGHKRGAVLSFVLGIQKTWNFSTWRKQKEISEGGKQDWNKIGTNWTCTERERKAVYGYTEDQTTLRYNNLVYLILVSNCTEKLVMHKRCGEKNSVMNVQVFIVIWCKMTMYDVVIDLREL